MVTEFHVEVVRVGAITKHPNADSLSLTMVRDYPVILRTGDFRAGDLAVYVPADAVVPEQPRWAFLQGHRRIKAKRLRGIFSMGLLTAADPSWVEGQEVAAEMEIVKYEPAEETESMVGDEPDPGILPVYGVEALRRWKGAFSIGEPVIVTEKIHGENARFVHDGTRLWCASRTRFKADFPGSQLWQAARDFHLETKLATVPGIGFYGEVYGNTGGFPYGTPKGSRFLRFFDAIDTNSRKWLDAGAFLELCTKLELYAVPVLYRGPWREDLRAYAEGKSTLDATHVREGIVIRPEVERYDMTGCGRVILKLHGEGFLTR